MYVLRIKLINLRSVWISPEQITYADMLSRQFDCDDLEVQDEIFTYQVHLKGHHNAERFTHDYNTKSKHTNLKYRCAGTSGIDAFTVDWKNWNNFLVSPSTTLIPKTI